MDVWKSAIGTFAGLSPSTYLKTIMAAGDIQLLNILLEYTASSDTGSRLLALEVSDYTGDVVITLPIPAALTVVATNVKTIQMSIGVTSYTAWDVNFAVVTLPSGIIVPGKHYLKIVDLAEISVNDTYTLDINFASRQKGAFEIAYPWWLLKGASGAVQVLQPKGAADYAASLVTLLGAVDASEGVAPDWDAVNGWKFNGVDDYLITGIIPTSVYTLILQYSNFASDGWIAGSNGVASTEKLGVEIATVNQYYHFGDDSGSDSNRTEGNACVNSDGGYYNGLFLNVAGSWSGTGASVYIGARNNNTVVADYSEVYIQALALYDNVLTAAQILAIATAMAAL